MEKKKLKFLIFLIILLFLINYSFLDKALINFFEDSEKVLVTRVIDGDTIEIGNYSIRLLGINTPERGEEGYDEAKQFLETIVLNKTIQLKYGKDKYDKYGRKLAYLFLRNANINKELVDEGYANIYFPSGKDSYYKDFLKAWEHCLENNKNLCEKSTHECTDCIKLKELNIKNQEVTLENICFINCDLTNWLIKEEGRKKFTFNTTILKSKQQFSWKNTESMWTKSGDTFFLRDKNNKLVLWKNI